MGNKKRVMVAMSGGVDSSVAAALLKDQGYDVIGVTMKLIDDSFACNESEKSCCGYDSTRSAKMVADVVGIRHYTVNTVDAFTKDVINNFVDEYRNGRTPNPCVRCNQFIKFDYLIKKMDELGCDLLATGHYAKIENGKLFKGDDPKKDQSYFLYSIYKTDVNRIIFPLAHMTKPEIRKLAEHYGLPVAQKKESQDICFIPDGDLASFLGRFIPAKEGDILDRNGKITGKHQGIHNYTIGQRKGLGAHGERVYATKIDATNNTVTAGTMDDLLSSTFEIDNLVLNRVPKDDVDNYEVQIRYNSSPVRATIKMLSKDKCLVQSENPIRSVTSGQSAVIYEGDEVLGGGIII